MLDRGQVEEFVERGFVVVPRAVPRELLGAAWRAVEELLRGAPPGPEVRGPHFFFPETGQSPALAGLLTGSAAFAAAESLTGAGSLEVPWQAQVALNIPPFPTVPGWHHIDGFPPEADGRPGTFTLLAGVLMTDQVDQDAGGLWVWPGSHLAHARYFREHGPDAFFTAGGYPPIRPSPSEQVRGRAGDLVLAHYLLGHNIGANTSQATRCAVYFRLKRHGHDARWRAFLQDPWLDYDAVRDVTD
ncbi:phytanoyl-CoA dioxygenase family protein [Streptacidiphilus sp. PB12-B1b]|uniref:phytanoyl-CoA dioxygenase family protein n=1 Tax=Streptacidiphilus sp. PB12-B1b TaxID=2705012 RepID=UPI0015FE63C4|nr:phytanoyl-CoA dioxygenase family protein [Streptacidiphilus sp. PB12-B1b]QMU77249.1 phytanoyl-CoA dioxygenase family protein [Streptacidiphilus sp. PB12-B1b]QMU77255.1 phytanoyl-CoA dioxygenase family protein [Streptacidiphilus sp. PB12-B1b]